jgi:hypothetical protein
MTSRTQEMLNWLVENGYTPKLEPEAINRFIKSTMQDDRVRQEDALQVAALLAALIGGIKAGDDMGVQLRQILKLRKQKESIFDPKTVYPGSGEWAIMERYVREEISYTSAVGKFKELYPVSRRQIQTWMRVMKPQVEESVKRNDSVMASWREFQEQAKRGDLLDS